MPTVVQATRIPMIQMTTSSSINVKPVRRRPSIESSRLPSGLVENPDVVDIEQDVEVLPRAGPRGDAPRALRAGGEADVRDDDDPVALLRAPERHRQRLLPLHLREGDLE